VTDRPFPDLPPEIAARVAAVREKSAEARDVVGKASTGIQQVAGLRADRHRLPDYRGRATFDPDEVSQAEHRVLVRICEGLSNEEIARLVLLSEETVKSHVRHMLARCCCRNRSQLAYRWGRGELSVVLVSGTTKVVIVEKTINP
jgi:DNA-binding NarL/FixJ family response regulator